MEIGSSNLLGVASSSHPEGGTVRRPARMLAPVNAVSLREAAAEFDIPPSTLSNWVKDGLISLAAERGRRGQPLLLDRASVRDAAAQYRPGRGQWNPRAIRETVQN